MVKVTFAPLKGEPETRTTTWSEATDPSVMTGAELVSVTVTGEDSSERLALPDIRPLDDAVRMLAPGAEVFTKAHA